MLTKVYFIALVCSSLVYADTVDWSLLQKLAEAAQSRRQSTADGRVTQASGSRFPFMQNSGQRNGVRNSEDRLPNWWESSPEDTDLRDWIERNYRNDQREIRSRSVGSSSGGDRDQAKRDWLREYVRNVENRQDLNRRDWWDGFGRTNQRSRNAQENDWWSSLAKALPTENRNDEGRDWTERNSRSDSDADFKNFLDQIIGMLGMESEVKKLMIPKSFFRF